MRHGTGGPVLVGLGLLVAAYAVQVDHAPGVGRRLRPVRGVPTIANGRDWTAFSSDVRVAKPATTEVMNFSSGEKARMFDFAILGTGHVQLVACPAATGTCSASAPGALTFDVSVG
jgi:hypothetical protein